MHRDWTIHLQEHSNGVLQTHSRYTDPVPTKSVICMSTEQDRMVGNLRMWKSMATIPGLLPFPTTPSFPVIFGTALTCATLPPLLPSHLPRNGLYISLLGFLFFFNCNLSIFPMLLASYIVILLCQCLEKTEGCIFLTDWAIYESPSLLDYYYEFHFC